MRSFVPFNREQAFLLPPDLRAWVPEDDLAHFVVAAVERVLLGEFHVIERAGGKPQYHPRLMLAVLIYCYANGIFSSRRVERATYRDIGVRFVAANLHSDHDTIAAFRCANKAAIEAAFLQVLLLARESGLLRLGMVSIDGTKLDADASKIRSVRYDRAQQLRAKLATDIGALTAQAEAADAEGTQLIVATNLVATPADASSFAATILGMEATVDLPRTRRHWLRQRAGGCGIAEARGRAARGDRADPTAPAVRLSPAA